MATIDDEDGEDFEEQLEDFAGLLPDADAPDGDMAENENLISAMETAQIKHQQKLVASNLVCNFFHSDRRCIFYCTVIRCIPPSFFLPA
jgi:hypothetical protein